MVEPIKKRPAAHTKAADGTETPSAGSAKALKEKLKKRMKIKVTKK
jgi:hypothetical protein